MSIYNIGIQYHYYTEVNSQETVILHIVDTAIVTSGNEDMSAMK